MASRERGTYQIEPRTYIPVLFMFELSDENKIVKRSVLLFLDSLEVAKNQP